MVKSYIDELCPFCKLKVKKEEEIIICSECFKPHHITCWGYNLQKCATFRCRGKGLDPSQVNNKSEVIQSVSSKRLLDSDSTVSFSKPKKVKLKNINNSKVVVSSNTHINTIKPRKQPKPRRINKSKIKSKQSNNNKKSIKVKSFTPHYRYAKLNTNPLKPKKMPKLRKFNYSRNRNDQNNLENIGYSSSLRPDPFIPEYTNATLREYLLEKQKENVKKTKKKYNFSQFIIKNKAETQINYSSVPKPDAFIPDYVNQDLREYLMERLKRKAKKKAHRKKMISLLRQTQNIEIYIEDDEGFDDLLYLPDRFIPDYVYEELRKKHVEDLSRNLIQTIKCNSCKNRIEISLEKCTFCGTPLIESNLKVNTYDLFKYKNEIDEINKEKSTPKYIPKKRVLKFDNLQFKNLKVSSIKINKVVFSPDNHYIAYCSQDNNLKVWDYFHEKCVAVLSGHNNWIRSLVFTPDSKKIITGSADKEIKIWDIEKQQCIKTLQKQRTLVDVLAISPDGKKFVSGGGYGVLKIWDLKSSYNIQTFDDDSEWVNSVCWNPVDNKQFAFATSDFIIAVLDLKEQSSIMSFKGHFDYISDIAYSPDGNYIASCSNDKHIKIWSCITKKCSKTIYAHDDNVTSIVFSPDGRYLFSSSLDKTIKIWNPISGLCIKELKNNYYPINSIAFSPNGQFLASSTDENIIKIWKLY